MLGDSEPQPKSVFKNPLFYSAGLVIIVSLAVVWIMVSRWLENRNFDRRAAQQRAEKQREQDRLAIQQLGGNEFAILSFYASPATIRRGQTAQLCYGVSNAKTVKLEPQAGPVWPSPARCLDVSPTKDTTYTLTIEDAAGNSKTATVEVTVH
jgi:hypothetical protein